MKITIEISEVDPVRANAHPHGFTAASSEMILPDDLKNVNMTVESVAEDVKKTVMNFLSMWGY